MLRGGLQAPLSEDKKKRIVDLYLADDRLNVKAVAEQVGCATSTAWNVLVANGIEIRGASKWTNEKNHTNRILRRWDAGKSSVAIARRYKLQRAGVARVIAANRPFDQRMRRLLRAVFGAQAEDHRFLNSLSAKQRSVGTCAICHESSRRLIRNYCPRTKRLRDLLCRRCNQALGCLDEDITKLRRAVAYLQKHGAVAKPRRETHAHTRPLSGPRGASSCAR